MNKNKTIAGFTEDISIPYLKKFNEFECRFGKERKNYKSSTPYYLVDLDKTFDTFFHSSKNCDFYFSFDVKNIDQQDEYKISGQKDDIYALEIFDSRPPSLSEEKILKQHFHGWYVHFNGKHTLKNPILMDIDLKQKHLCFTYVLPIDEYTILAEVTFYSDEILTIKEYESLLTSYLKDNFSNLNYDILKKEKGAIPLINIKSEVRSPNYHCLGIRGGRFLRASTGYSVLSFLNQSRPTKLLQYLDSFLLKILWRTPEVGNFIFAHFLKNINGETLADFMSDRPSLINIFRAVISMPFSVFVPHFFKKKKGLKHLRR